MGPRIIRPALLTLAAVMLAVMACTGETGPPACTPLEGETGDPCEGDFTQISGPNADPDRFLGVEPWPIRFQLDGGDGTRKIGHIVVRGQYTPGTVRCATRNINRSQPHTGLRDHELESGLGFVRCYADLQVADYIVGSGPSTLTVLAESVYFWDPGRTSEEAEAARRSIEQVFITGGSNARIEGVPSGGITGVEAILFLGPATDASLEVWQVFTIWDVERQDDGTVIAVHPDRGYWEREDYYETEYRSQVEITLPAFKTAAQAAHEARHDDYDGRIDADEGTPQLVTDANNLHAFHVETGNVNHPDGPPELPPPVPER